MTVIELRDRTVAETEAAREIKDKCDQEARGMTEEEAVQFDHHVKEAKRLEKEAERQETLEAMESRLAAPKDRKSTPETANGSRIEVGKPDMFRFGSLRAFKGKQAEANAYTSGKWLMATVMNDAASRQWCRDKGIEMRVQTEGVATAGGFLVPEVMERSIIDLREQYGMFRQAARVIPMSSDHSLIPRRTGGVTAYFVGETDAITESDKSWNQVELTAKKLGALTRMSTDLSEDAIINIADDLAQEMAYAFAVKEDGCGIDGDGTSTYGGMVGMRTKMVDGNHVGSYIAATTPALTYAQIDQTEITEMIAALPMYARANAKWYCSPEAKAGIFDRLAMAAGGNTLNNVGDGPVAKYQGFPIIEGAAMPSTVANGLIALWLGDMSLSSTLGDRRGITLKVSSERYLEYDQIGIQATERFCIVNHDIGGTTGVRGPVVGLQGTT